MTLTWKNQANSNFDQESSHTQSPTTIVFSTASERNVHVLYLYFHIHGSSYFLFWWGGGGVTYSFEFHITHQGFFYSIAAACPAETSCYT